MYREGRGTTKDEKKDSDWFMKEAENQQSCPRGNIYVAWNYYFSNDIPVDYEKDVRWYLAVVNQSDTYANLNFWYLFRKI